MENKYSKDIVVQGISRIVGGVFAFLSVFILTYLFDENQIGEYNLILSSVNFIVSFMTLWISQSILRFYTGSDEKNSIFTMTIIVSLLGLIIFTIINTFMGFDVSIHAFIYLVVFSIYNILDSIFRRQRELYKYAILELTISIGKMLPMIFIAKMTRDINAVFISQSILLFIFISFILFRNCNYRKINLSLDLKLLKKYLKYGFPLVGLSISNWLLVSSDRYIIRYFKSGYEVGIYSTNYALANSIYMMFALILLNAFHPIIMKTWDTNHIKAEQLTTYIVEKYILFMCPLVFFGCYRASVLLGLFKGNTYAHYRTIFVWTSLGIFVYGLSLLYHKYFELTNNTKYILLFNLISAIINIILNFICIPRYGFEIAAFTTFISYTIYLLLVFFKMHDKFKIKLPFKKISIIFISNLLYYLISKKIIKNESFKIFIIEGIIYVVYTLIIYQITFLCDFRIYFKHLIKYTNKK